MCILIEDTAPASEIKEIQLITALHRADLKPYEVFCGFSEWLKAHPGKGGKDLAAALDRSEASVSMTLSLSRCIRIVQEAAAAGQIGLKDWHAISQAPEGEQESLLMAKLQGASAEGLKRMRRKPATICGADGQAVSRCQMGSGVCVTLAGVGQGLTLEDIEETLSALLKEVRRGKEQGLD